jgi:hypothetical protein
VSHEQQSRHLIRAQMLQGLAISPFPTPKKAQKENYLSFLI